MYWFRKERMECRCIRGSEDSFQVSQVSLLAERVQIYYIQGEVSGSCETGNTQPQSVCGCAWDRTLPLSLSSSPHHADYALTCVRSCSREETVSPTNC